MATQTFTTHASSRLFFGSTFSSRIKCREKKMLPLEIMILASLLLFPVLLKGLSSPYVFTFETLLGA